MSGPIVESRRFRTWDHTETPDEKRRWLLIAQAQWLRYYRSWHFWVIIGLAVVLTVVSLIGTFVLMDESYGGLPGDFLAYFVMTFIGILVGFALLLVCAPTIADDVRFNAPLFYFSRPMHVRDYAIGKTAFSIGFLLLLALPPVLVSSMAAVGTWGADGPPLPADPGPNASEWRQEQYQRELARYPESVQQWKDGHMDHFGDWIFTYGMLTVGVVVSALFLGALTGFLSSITQRGWHASMALVVTLAAGLAIGLPLGFVLMGDESTLAAVFSFTVWPAAVTLLPLDAYYSVPYFDGESSFYDDTPATVVLSLIGMLGSTFLLYWLTYRRLQRLEGAL